MSNYQEQIDDISNKMHTCETNSCDEVTKLKIVTEIVREASVSKKCMKYPTKEELDNVITRVCKKLNKISMLFRERWNQRKKESKRFRSDTMFQSMVRKIKRTVSILLLLFYTEFQLRDYLHQKYFRCFKEGFVPLFCGDNDFSDDELNALYKEFISIIFPYSKVMKIHEIEYGESLEKNNFLKNTRNSSKQNIKLQNNQAFRLIVSKLVSCHKLKKIELHEEALGVLNKILEE